MATSTSPAGRHNGRWTSLNHDIDGLVDLKIQSGEGALVYPGRLRAWLTSIAGQVSMAFVPPTPAMVQVADGYISDAASGVSRLQSDVAAATDSAESLSDPQPLRSA